MTTTTSHNHRTPHRPSARVLLIVAAALLITDAGPGAAQTVAQTASWSSRPAPASAPVRPAGDLFSTLFGAFAPPAAAPSPARTVPVMAYGPSGLAVDREAPAAPMLVPDAAPAQAAYCVRLCDGRFFPLTPAPTVTPAKLCGALCPASRTKVFEGPGIDQAMAPDGSRYAALPTAHLYRRELVGGCTCNGRDAFGLAKIDLAADPTLRTGDVVATGDGFKVFRGAAGSRHRAADFTPVRRSPLVADDIRHRLRTLRIARDTGAARRL
ncbi:MAG: DUF2865 domain-containing protein [Rhodovulum sp.]|nr:DUF2865 domain-containing protein [Rhodovulum sp.]